MPETEIIEESNAGVAESRKWFLLRRECWVPLAIFIGLAYLNLRSEKWLIEINFGTKTLRTIGWAYGGVIYSQPLLCTFWGIWAPHAPLWKIPTAICSFFILCCFLIANEFPLSYHLLIEAYVVSFILITSLLLRYIGKLRIRLYPEHLVPMNSDPNKKAQHQFSIKYLLIWTTLISILLMVGRITLPEQTSYDLLQNISLSRILDQAIYGICNCLILTPATIALVLTFTNLKWWKSAALISITLPLYAYLATIIISTPFSFEPMWELVINFGATAIGAIISTGLSALALRWAGYRLVRDGVAPAS